jgi:hypothetical protein
MSLINDALKKAQQLQTQGQPPPNPGVTPNAPAVTGSGQAGSPRASSDSDRSMPGQFFMLLAFGAGALIAVSVLATVYLLRRPAAPVVVQAPAVLSPTVAAAPVVAQAPATPIAPEKPALAPVVKAPALALPLSIPPATPAEVFAPAPAPVVTKLPAPPPTAAPTVSVTPPAVSLPAVSLSNPPNGSNPSNGFDPSKPDPKILAYIDALQIAGIRVSDTGSKVLMNDRVFRENEIVDHLLGLRLKKVESDNLTFVDERGVIYTKSF